MEYSDRAGDHRGTEASFGNFTNIDSIVGTVI